MKSPIRSDIRRDMWVKLMGNVAFNPISALTGATLAEIGSCPETRTLALEIMSEVDAVAKSMGVEMGISVEQRMEGAQKVGHHKPSTLQDVEAGKPTEVDAIAGAVVELGRRMNVPIPRTESVLCLSQVARQQAALRALKASSSSH